MSLSSRLFVLPLLFLALGQQPKAIAAPATVNKIVAVVNGEMITLHEVRARIGIEMAQQRKSLTPEQAEALVVPTLDTMINDILMRQEAKRLKITVADTEIDPEIRRMVQRSRMSQRDFEARLVSQGSSIKELREQIQNNIMRQRIYAIMVARKITVPEEDVRRFYEANKDMFTSEKKANFSILMFPPNVDAQSIYAQIKSNAISFEEAAKKYSVDPNSKNGGNVGAIPWDRIPPPMQNLFSQQLKPGQMTPLVRIDKNMGIIRLNSIDPGGKVMPFEEVKREAEDRAREPLVRERMNDYIKQLRGKAVIDMRL